MKKMGRWFFLLLINFCTFLVEAHEHRVNYQVTRSDYTFSTLFEMIGEKFSGGSVVKNVFHITTHYDAYDSLGDYEGQGVCRLFCLGAFYVWGTEIDIYNEEGKRVALIDGQAVSSEPAKFSFYDESGGCVAIAYLDQNSIGFSLIDPHHPTCILARLNRNFILDSVDNWDVAIYYPEKISLRLVKIFAAFVCDMQHKFKPDL